MKIRIIAVAFVVTSGLMAGPVLAADQGGYIGVSIGQSKVDLDKGEIDASLATLGLGGNTSVDDTGDSFKIFGGYQLNRNLALELGYVNFGKFTSNTTITSGGSGTLNGEWEAWAVDFSVLGILPLGESGSLFGRLGASAWSLDLDLTAIGPGGVGTASESASGVSAVLGLDGAFKFTPNFALRAEYERHFSVGDNNTGKSDIDLITVGVVYHF